MEKLKKYRLLILVLLVTILFGFSIEKSTTISADEETLPSSSENLMNESTEYSVATDQNKVESSGVKDDAQVELKNEEDVTNPFSFYMKDSDQTREFGATAIPQVISVGDTFNKKPEELVKNIVLPEGHTATFSYVDGKVPFIDNTVANSVILKVYMLDNEQPETKLLIKVPLAIMEKDSSLKIAAGQDINQLSIDYADYSAKVTTIDQQTDYLMEKAGIVMWEIATGNPVKIASAKDSYPEYLLPSKNPLMNKASLLVYTSSSTDKNRVSLTINVMFKEEKQNIIEQKLLNELLAGWDHLPKGSKLGIIKDDLTSGFMGMPYRGGDENDNYQNESFYTVGNKYRNNAFFDAGSTNNYTAYIDNKRYDSLYGFRTPFLGKTLRYYVKKGDRLRQVFVDRTVNIIYVVDAYKTKSGYFSEDFSIYNTGSTNTSIGVHAAQRIDYAGYSGFVSLYDKGAGFIQSVPYYEGTIKKHHSLSIKFKDGRGNFLGDQDRWAVGTTFESNAKPNNKPPILLLTDAGVNYFKDDFSKRGMENDFYPNNTVIFSNKDDVRSQVFHMGMKPRLVAPGEKVTSRIHYFSGDEIPYMIIEATPKEYNVYEEYDRDTKFEYLLSNIPAAGDNGTIEFTFPDETTKQVDYIADENKTSKGSFIVPRATLPKVLNSDPGTIKSYATEIYAENEQLGIPTDDYAVPINVYNLGAKPIPQLIQKGKAFTKKPSELIKDPVILPGNTAVYEYEGELPDTSVVGLTSVLVRMTDKERPEKTTLIKVPVEVTSDTPPTSGLYLAAKDYTSVVQEIQGITEEQVAELILKKSEAIAWDVSSGSSEDVTLSVQSTTLKPNSPVGSYKASIEAVKGTLSKTKDIGITIVDKQTVKVEFLDEVGESMHEPVSLLRTVGTKIDLTKEDDVQTAIKEIQDKRYQLYQRPENETALEVPNQDTTVTYRFKGTLFVSSYPTFMNFGVKGLQASTPFIRVEKAQYNKPLTIWDNRKGTSPWVLTATLEKALTSLDDDSKILPEAIRYKIDNATTVTLKQGSAEPILTKKSEETGDVIISDGWDKGDSGLQLEVPTGKVLQAGKYYATILWQVADTP